MKFLHTADWHIGRQFHNTSLLADQEYILRQLVNLAVEEKVDAIVIAGDVYDRAVPPAEAVALLNDILEQLIIENKIQVIMISGNHDSADRLGFGAKLLTSRGLHVYGPIASASQPLVLKDKFGPIYFCPFPYAEPSQIRLHLGDDELRTHATALKALTSLTRENLPKKARSVAIGHCWVNGSKESDSERPLTVGGAGEVNRSIFSGFNYSALGHLHRPQHLGSQVYYAGSLLKYSFSEISHNKSVNIVELDESGNVNVELVELNPRRDVRMIEGYMEDLLKGPAGGESAEDYLLIRLADRKAILDAVGKLRQVYPNILHLERPGLFAGGSSKERSIDHRNRSELDLFKDFYEEVSDAPMIDGGEEVFTGALDSINRSDERVSS